MAKFKGYEILSSYPEDGWLKGYFYARNDDIKGGEDNLKGAYRDMGYIRHKDYILHLLNVKKDEKILDVGCADGPMMTYCGLLGAEVYGVDISSEYIEKVNIYLKKYSLKGQAIEGDARKLRFADNFFDKVISSDFFEHMCEEDNISVLKEMKRVLKPGGIIVIKTPNLKYLRFSKLFKMIMRVIKLKNPFDVLIPHTTGNNPQHIGLLTKIKMVKIIKAAGFLNFRFYYDANSKIERFNYSLSELLSENAYLRDIFAEDLIVLIRKPVILSFFP
ncbi:MAG: class I SAM-dependent methyltransferase [Candidatus Omnitrophota bacterium]